jgi:ankyrin repeat protein
MSTPLAISFEEFRQLIAMDLYDKVKNMLDKTPDLIHTPDCYGRMPMYYVVENQRPRMARLLLAYHPDLFREDRFGLSTIDYAIYYDEMFHTNFLELLLPDGLPNGSLDAYKEKWDRVYSTFRISYTLRRIRED